MAEAACLASLPFGNHRGKPADRALIFHSGMEVRLPGHPIPVCGWQDFPHTSDYPCRNDALIITKILLKNYAIFMDGLGRFCLFQSQLLIQS